MPYFNCFIYKQCRTREKEKFSMKKVKYNFILLLGLFLTINLTSCSDDDGYNLNDFVLSLATVNPIDVEKGTYSLILDDGTTLWPTASNVLYRPKYGQRVLVSYTILSDQIGEYDHYIRVNNIYDILTKKVVDLTAENEKEIGNDPIKLLSMWVGDDYLNIHFGVNVGGGQAKHAINLVQNKLSVDVQNTSDNEITLEFRHNANGDPENYGEKSFVAFDLRPFKKEGKDSVTFVIKVKDYDGEMKTYPITYVFDGINTTKNINSTEIPDINLQIE